jgi:glycosyltransferase involved in cell wall biosynthesis
VTGRVRVTALVPYPLRRAPGQRYRIEQWAPLMRREGVEVDVLPFLDDATLDVLYARGHLVTKGAGVVGGYARRLLQLGRLQDYDVAYVFREAAFLPSTFLEKAVARRLPFVYDFDDAIYLPATSAANASLRFLKSTSKASTLCSIATHVTVGNAHLADYARRHSRAVTIIPSTIDTSSYLPGPRRPSAVPVIGWTGSATTVPYLEEILPALRVLGASVDFELRVIGGRISTDGLRVTCVPWNADSEVEDLRAIDIGLMPLPDDEWTRGKCGMKALQYMGLAIPAVVSPVGANAEIVRDGENGFHARSQEDWVARLRSLIEDVSLRMRLGAAGRETVEKEYSAAVHAPRLAGILRELAAR